MITLEIDALIGARVNFVEEFCFIVTEKKTVHVARMNYVGRKKKRYRLLC